jgi:transmembrane sensor
MIDSETAEQIDEAAFAWVARRDRFGSSPTLDAELEAWLAGDPRRRGAFLQAEAAWSLIDRAAQTGPAPRLAAARPTRRWAMAGGGGLLAAGLATAWVMLREEAVTTAVGEVRHVPLADGSRMILNTETRASVAMKREVRRVRLADGEAWFHVAKDAERPFVVEAGAVRVRAVGTAFSVRRLPRGAEVLVNEGVVEAWLVGDDPARTRIAAGQSARVLEGQPIRARLTEGDEIDRKLAWRAGKIDLDGETLDDAVAQFNRYNRRKLTVEDTALGARRLYGVFRAEDPEGFARSAGLSLGVQVRFTPTEIFIGV